MMNLSPSEKIRLAEKHVGGPPAELGFSISRKNRLDICFSRTVDGVRQDIQVVSDRYADEVCARYGTSRRIDLTMQKRRVREFMARACPWHRPGDLEWISYDVDEGLPEALDRPVFVIQGIGLEILDEMMKSAPAEAAASDEDPSAAIQENHPCTASRQRRRRGTRKSHVSGLAGTNGPRSCLQRPERNSLPTASGSGNGTTFRTGGSLVRLRSARIMLRPVRQNRRL